MECVFENLALRGHGRGMTMDVFLSFIQSNSLVGERLFNIFDKNNSGYLSYEEFACGLEILYKGTPAERAALTFALYDLTSSGTIKKVDMKMMLHYMPARMLEFATKIIVNAPQSLRMLQKLDALDAGRLHGERLCHEAGKYVDDLRGALEETLHLHDAKRSSSSAATSPTTTKTKSTPPPPTTTDGKRRVSASSRSQRQRRRREAQIARICDAVFSGGEATVDYDGFRKLMRENPVLVTALSSVLLHPAEMARETLLHSQLKNAGEAEATDDFVCSLTALEIALEGEEPGRGRAATYHRELDPHLQNELEGRVLKKVSSGGWHERFCTLRGRVLWQYKSDRAKRPYKALFLEGCVVEPSCNRKRGFLHPKQLFGVHIEVVNDDDDDDDDGSVAKTKTIASSSSSSSHHPSWEFFFEREAEQRIWLKRLAAAAHTVQFSDAYDTIRLLGQGRAGKVYMVRAKTGRRDPVAVKVIEKARLGRTEQQMLRTESRILRFISHPNCVQLRDIFEERERVYLIMEMLPMDFFDAISGKPRFDERKWFGVYRALSSALVYLHDMGIVHRDMKPENILCNEDLSVIKLTDFGLARILLPEKHLKLDAGTAAYKAPEVIKCRGYGAAADVWGVGVIMYLVLAGRWPFDGADQIRQILADAPELSDAAWSERSAECVDLVRALLDKSPEGRPTSEEMMRHPWARRMLLRSGSGGGDSDAESPLLTPALSPATTSVRRMSSLDLADEDRAISAHREETSPGSPSATAQYRRMSRSYTTPPSSPNTASRRKEAVVSATREETGLGVGEDEGR